MFSLEKKDVRKVNSPDKCLLKEKANNNIFIKIRILWICLSPHSDHAIWKCTLQSTEIWDAQFWSVRNKHLPPKITKHESHGKLGFVSLSACVSNIMPKVLPSVGELSASPLLTFEKVRMKIDGAAQGPTLITYSFLYCLKTHCKKQFWLQLAWRVMKSWLGEVENTMGMDASNVRQT